MLLGMVLLYVGAVLVLNGIWLFGQARAAEAATAGLRRRGRRAAQEPELTGEATLAGESPTASSVVTTARGDPTLIDNREIAILNVFTGFVGVVAAVTLAAQGNQDGDIASIRAAAYILLFAFTYLWVAYNQFAGVSGHAFGWYCLFVAITAVVAGIYTFSNAEGNGASIYLGIDWLVWAVLWFLFFALLALERPIARMTGLFAVAAGVGTSWIFAILLLEDSLSF
jgi:uncharacterized protein YjeT (DUF2065 family)